MTKQKNPWPDLPFKRALCGAPPPVEKTHKQEECVECDGTGHANSCASHERAYDLGDLICRLACAGCCPNTCPVKGVHAEQDAAARDVHRLVGR